LEIKELFRGYDFNIKSMADAGISADIDETGATFEENAIIKAHYISERTSGAVVMADDSGLCVDILGGAPGVRSARYGGAGLTDADRCQLLLREISGSGAVGDDSERTARFVCVIAVILPSGESFTVEGTCEGLIAKQPLGSNGFGYDPVFFLPQYQKTMAQLDMPEKNMISHRAKAVELAKKVLLKSMNG
jgi:XTP/dITP diphosphohydrolase